MEAIYTLLAGLAGIAFIAMIVGLIRPELVLRWGEKRTRERVLLYYGIGAIVLGGLAKTVIIYTLLTGLPMIVTLVLIVGLIRPELVLRWGKKRTRMRVFLYCGIGIFVLRSLADTVMPDEVREEQKQARLEQEREKEQARLEREKQKEQARLKLARENLEKGTRLFSTARTAYESQDYQTAIDSADEATRALKKAKSSIDEAAVLANQAQAFLDSAKAAEKKEQEQKRLERRQGRERRVAAAKKEREQQRLERERKEAAIKKAREEARYTTNSGTLERIMEKHVLHVFGYKASRGAKEDDPLTVISISAGYTADVAYREGVPAWGDVRKDIIRQANQFMRRVFTDPACSKVQIVLLRPHLELHDKYGQTFEAQVGKLLLNREVAEKINWDIVGFDMDMFERLLRTEGQLWWHNALKK